MPWSKSEEDFEPPIVVKVANCHVSYGNLVCHGTFGSNVFKPGVLVLHVLLQHLGLPVPSSCQSEALLVSTTAFYVFACVTQNNVGEAIGIEVGESHGLGSLVWICKLMRFHRIVALPSR